MESTKVVFIGSGKVATNLSLAFHKVGIRVLQIFSRNIENAKILAKKTEADFIDDLSKLNQNADIYFFVINDDAIFSVLENHSFKNKILVHTSGSLEMDVFNNITGNYGVFYPLQSFNKQNILTFDFIPLCVEASNAYTLSQLKKIANLISKEVYEIDSNQRKILHLAAVFASNFTNFMYIVAEEILKKEGLDFKILFPLIKQTALRVAENSPSDLMTGPAKRKDMKIIKKHLDFLEDYPEYKEIYNILSEKIISKYK